MFAISEINMELGTFYAVFTRFWGFDPLTWNIQREYMLKSKFEMVHVNQRTWLQEMLYFKNQWLQHNRIKLFPPVGAMNSPVPC